MLRQLCPFGRDDGMMHAFSDFDRLGSPRTGKPTSGEVLYVGSCTIKHRSLACKVIALSFVGVELYAAMWAISEASCLKAMWQDWRESSNSRVGRCSHPKRFQWSERPLARLGTSRLVSFESRASWREANVSCACTVGKHNPVDILTNAGSRDILGRHLQHLGCQLCSGPAIHNGHRPIGVLGDSRHTPR